MNKVLIISDKELDDVRKVGDGTRKWRIKEETLVLMWTTIRCAIIMMKGAVTL